LTPSVVYFERVVITHHEYGHGLLLANAFLFVNVTNQTPAVRLRDTSI